MCNIIKYVHKYKHINIYVALKYEYMKMFNVISYLLQCQCKVSIPYDMHIFFFISFNNICHLTNKNSQVYWTLIVRMTFSFVTDRGKKTLKKRIHKNIVKKMSINCTSYWVYVRIVFNWPKSICFEKKSM